MTTRPTIDSTSVIANPARLAVKRSSSSSRSRAVIITGCL